MLWVMARHPFGPSSAGEETADAPARAEPGLRSWAERAASGDRNALEALLRDNASAVYGLCHHVAGPVDGPDAAQEALERIVLQIRRFDPARGEFRSWALTVARNVCRDRLRRRSLERGAFARDGETATALAASEVPDPERSALARLETNRMARALEGLPEGMRTAVVLFHVHGQSYEDIAAALEVPKGTVMTWLHRGRRKLRDALEEDAEQARGEVEQEAER
ncbi:MAG: RNA polymerase sigma factor [Polyangiales bacterium]